MKVLLLDDSPERVAKFMEEIPWNVDVFVVRTAEDCINVMENMDFTFDVVWLDHDLGGEIYVDANNDNTGSAVVRHLAWMNSLKRTVPVRRFVCHSMNTTARLHMVADLKKMGYDVIDVSWGNINWESIHNTWNFKD